MAIATREGLTVPGQGLAGFFAFGAFWLTMPRLPLHTCALGTGGVLQWSGAAEKAVADFGGPVRASKGAKAAGEGLRVRGGEHS